MLSAIPARQRHLQTTLVSKSERFCCLCLCFSSTWEKQIWG
jgi:hypothetical protein